MSPATFEPGGDLALDLTYARREWSPRFFFVTEAFAALVLIATFVGQPRGWLDVGTTAIAVHVGLHALIFAISVFVVGAERLDLPRFWPVQLADLFARITISSVFGASAVSAYSPAWGLVLLFGIIWTNVKPFNPFVATMILGVPIAMRATWAPSHDAAGLWVAFGVGVVTLLLYFSGSRVAVRQRHDVRRRSAQLLLTDLARDRAASLKAAMSLHDGLSGVLFVARHVAHRSESAAEVTKSARLVLDRARRVVEDILRGGFVRAAAFDEALRSAVRIGGAGMKVTVDGNPQLAMHALSDVIAVIAEATSNSARHASAPAEIQVRFWPQTVQIRCTSKLSGALNRASAQGRSARASEPRPRGPITARLSVDGAVGTARTTNTNHAVASPAL